MDHNGLVFGFLAPPAIKICVFILVAVTIERARELALMLAMTVARPRCSAGQGWRWLDCLLGTVTDASVIGIGAEIEAKCNFSPGQRQF
jgi:hypothetical protein